MPKSSKPRKKYRPKGVMVNTMEYAMENVATLSSYHSNYLLDLKIKNSDAMVSLMRGTARKRDMDTLVAMSNIVEALWQLGFGKEYENVSIEGRYALLSIIHRASTHGRFTPFSAEIAQLNTLMELHDAQMDIITVRDIEKAIRLAQRKLRSDKDIVRLPDVPEHLK